MNWTALWQTVRTNPVCVAVWTAFAGALTSEAASALQAGTFDWSVAAIQKMAVSAGTVAVLALLHLYTPAPGANPKP